MISPKISLQKFEKNLEIEKKIGHLYGYHLQNSQFEAPKSKQKQKKQKLLINERINPLQVKEKQIEPSRRLKQLNKEIEQLQIQKKINKMSDQEEAPSLDIPSLINTKIKEYNYLIDHKHLSHRKPAKSLFFSSTPTNTEEVKDSNSLIKQILFKQKDLNKTNGLTFKFRRNQQIVGLYREYSTSMRMEDKLKASKTNVLKIPKIKVNVSVDLKNQVKIRNSQSMNLGRKPRYQEEIDINSPFVETKFIQNSNQLNESLRRSRKQSQFIKQKLLNLRQKIQMQNSQSNPLQQVDKQEVQQALKTNLSEFSLEYDLLTSRLKQTNSEVKQSQKSYMSLALQKISPRYVKCQGSKFLTKYNTDQVANAMVEGPKFKQKKIEPILKSNIKKVKIPANLNEEDKMVMGLMIEEESDSYYWTTCKNEKINLMLKSHKPH